MVVLISHLERQNRAFRQALGELSEQVRVVENNLAALALLAALPEPPRALVITEHQDEGINIDTPTVVRSAAQRCADQTQLIVVGPLLAHLASPTVQAVETLEQAATLVLELVSAAPIAMAAPGNGHTQLATEHLVTVVEPPHAPAAPPIAATARASASADAAGATPSDADAAQQAARSLADDIRDWTERHERQRSQSLGPGLDGAAWWQRFSDWLPTQRRMRAEERALDAQIRAPRLSRCQSIAVISPKGGVGKSFLTYMIGNFLADVRGDKVIAIDTNPDFGTLADQVRGREAQTVGTLLQQLDTIRHYSDLRRFTSKVESRLEVLAAPADPDIMASITAQDYGRIYEQLVHYYDTVIFDCGTGFRDDITRFALEQSDQIVLVSAPLFITTGIVVRALGYLDQIGCRLERVTLAINQVRGGYAPDMAYLRSRFGHRLNAIVEIPFDLGLHHATDRGEFSMAQTRTETRVSIKRLVRELARHFG